MTFNYGHDSDYHVAVSPFTQLSCGLVSDFPLDYMHLMCFGVVRRLLHLPLDVYDSVLDLSTAGDFSCHSACMYLYYADIDGTSLDFIKPASDEMFAAWFLGSPV